jgi:nucleolar protein 56
MYWFGSGNDISIDPEESAARVAAAKTDMADFVPADWRNAAESGLVSSHGEYVMVLRNVAFLMAERGIAASAGEKDVELLHMVRMLDEMDTVINLMTERLTDWYISVTPNFSRKYQNVSGAKLVFTISKKGSAPMKKVAGEILSLSGSRTNLMKEISRKASAVIPNMSALVGGLVAARIISRAGGLAKTAKLPGSSIQVIGAESALFSHIRTGSPPPKHGIIFQHRRVHNAAKDVRGHVARLLSAKLAIAARLDLYRGEPVLEFLDEANRKIDHLMEEKA